MNAQIKEFVRMLRKEKGTFTCEALFSGSVSAEHPNALMNSFLQGFMKKEGRRADRNIDQAEELVKRVKNRCAISTVVRDDLDKKKLLKKWVEQDLCFSTRSVPNVLRPLCLNVVYVYPWDARESYHKHFFALLRAGRKSAALNLDEPLRCILESFAEEPDDPAGSAMIAAFPLPGNGETKALKDWGREGVHQYQDKILCSPHCRLFQDDIIHVLEWEMPRTLRLNLIKRLMLYHFCTLYVRMSMLIDDLVKTAGSIISAPEPYRGVELPCVSCRKDYRANPDSYGELAEKCKFHPSFSLGEKSQRWYDVLIRYHRNVAAAKALHKFLEQGNFDTIDKVLDFYSLIRKNRTRYEECGSLLSELERILEDRPPKEHAWTFFSKFASNEQETSFAGKQRKGSFQIRLSSDLITAWAHIFVSTRESKHKTPLFLDFLDFLRERGVKCSAGETTNLEKDLLSLRLLRHYADMGIARELEPTLTKLQR